MHPTLSKIISLLFHPVFVPFYLCMLYMHICPSLFASVPSKTFGEWHFLLAFNTILYPLLVTFLLWKLHFIDSIYMRTQPERYVPLIACILFYFWTFYVFHRTTNAPLLFRSMLFGNFFTVSFLFVLTIFAKISMHTTAMGGAIAISYLMVYYLPINFLPYSILIILIAALVGVARLTNKAHTPAEIVTGFLLGFVVQLLTWLVYK